ncbi:hypothetical protein [Sodalis sp.]|uniref:hypothetical protein n=1 Tax=Sodalis sp. (in: enterobacteria) TaxID=1898979 RepID=UPI00387345E5
MAKTLTYRISGYGVNVRGNTLGIHYDIAAPDEATARTEMVERAAWDGFTDVRILRVKVIVAEEVAHV